MGKGFVRPLVVAGAAAIALVAVPTAAEADHSDCGIEVDHIIGRVRSDGPLTGDQVIPGPGSESASASFLGFAQNPPDGTELITRLFAHRLAATGVHIHRGARGEAGELVAELAVPEDPFSVSGCEDAVPDEIAEPADLSESELLAVLARPGDYYLDLHTADFPEGAVRAQLLGR